MTQEWSNAPMMGPVTEAQKAKEDIGRLLDAILKLAMAGPFGEADHIAEAHLFDLAREVRGRWPSHS